MENFKQLKYTYDLTPTPLAPPGPEAHIGQASCGYGQTDVLVAVHSNSSSARGIIKPGLRLEFLCSL